MAATIAAKTNTIAIRFTCLSFESGNTYKKTRAYRSHYFVIFVENYEGNYCAFCLLSHSASAFMSASVKPCEMLASY
jgi:hypothetical protein